MILKRLIAISVVFALVAGTAFAVDLGAEVIGTIVLLQGDNGEDSKPTSYGVFDRFRFQGSGENDSGTFGAWIRFNDPWYNNTPTFEGLGWWKPIDQLKLTIGGNSDGFWDKWGVTGWNFYQRVTDTPLSDRGNNPWGGGRYGFQVGPASSIGSGGGLQFGDAFYVGFGGHGLLLDIKPVDVLGINIGVPFISATGQPWLAAEPKSILKKTNAQIDVNLDFGNIALSYAGDVGELTELDDDDGNYKGLGGGGKLYLYFGLTSIENLGLDVSVGFTLPVSEENEFPVVGKVKTTYLAPIAAGLGVKYGGGDFGIKARLAASFGGSLKTDADGDKPEKVPLQVLFDVLPNYRVSDNLKIFFSLGLGIVGSYQDPDGNKIDDSSQFGFHINPYVWVGEEWGPSFWAGFKLESVKQGAADAVVTWSVPIAIGVSF